MFPGGKTFPMTSPTIALAWNGSMVDSFTCSVSQAPCYGIGRSYGGVRLVVRRIDVAPSISQCFSPHPINWLGAHCRGHCRSHVVRCLHRGTEESHLSARRTVRHGSPSAIFVFDLWRCGYRRLMGKFCCLAHIGGGDCADTEGRHATGGAFSGCEIRHPVHNVCRSKSDATSRAASAGERKALRQLIMRSHCGRSFSQASFCWAFL